MTYEFKDFAKLVENKVNQMQKANDILFRLDVNGDEFYEFYQNSFPKGTNVIYKERREYECSTCRNFIKNMGIVVAVDKEGNYVTVWDVTPEGYYSAVVEKLQEYLKNKPIKTIFLTSESSFGGLPNYDAANDTTWNHFFAKVDKKFQMAGDLIPSWIGNLTSTKEVFQRSVEEITDEAIDTVIELIEGKALYRGEAILNAVKSLKAYKTQYAKEKNKEAFCFAIAKKFGESVRYRNTSYGTLLVEISEGTDVEAAVNKYEQMVAPSNYKRSKPVITEGKKKQAKEKFVELGLEGAEHRRMAVESDISINDVAFVDRSVKLSDSPFDSLDTTSKKPTALKNVVDVSIDTFMADILPKAKTLEVMMKNNHVGNLMALVAPVYPTAGNMLQWDNNFSWAYNGDVADSFMRREVVNRGGSVSGWLRFTHSWNHNNGNNSLMDLHVFTPACDYKHVEKAQEIHDNYPSNVGRVGWNHRKDMYGAKSTLGVQDVDYTNHAPHGYVPVENITFPSKDRLMPGKYYFKIHNWDGNRNRNTEGFKAEIEVNGKVYSYDFRRPLKHKEWITVAVMTLHSNGTYDIEHKIPTEEETSVSHWGVKTNTFTKVKMVTLSPNFWNGQTVGNKHWFFILEDCKTEEPVRGFFPEYLRKELYPHRQVFEVLGSAMMVQPTENQLSGLGFSSTITNELTVKVTGNTTRIYNVKFNV